MVAFINSDIILLDNFSEKFSQTFDLYGPDIFIAGSRKNIQLNYYVNSLETYLKVQQEQRKLFNLHSSSDIFITSKNVWEDVVEKMPEFILGRFCWDNWFHMYAEKTNLKKFNCTTSLIILHCNHEYEHTQIEHSERRKAPSSLHNFKLWKDVAGVELRVDLWNPLVI
jgi:hypothetical protein